MTAKINTDSQYIIVGTNVADNSTAYLTLFNNRKRYCEWDYRAESAKKMSYRQAKIATNIIKSVLVSNISIIECSGVNIK